MGAEMVELSPEQRIQTVVANTEALITEMKAIHQQDSLKLGAEVAESKLSVITNLRMQMLIAETEVLVAEMKLKESHLRRNWEYHNQGSIRALRNPIVIGTILIMFAITGATLVTYIHYYFQQKAEQVHKSTQFELEIEKFRFQAELDNTKHEAFLITNAIQQGGGDQIKVVQNLRFLLDSGLISKNRTELDLYLRTKPGGGL
jgi:cytochrome c-type biogenesis protein CcmH/NrfG